NGFAPACYIPLSAANNALNFVGAPAIKIAQIQDQYSALVAHCAHLHWLNLPARWIPVIVPVARRAQRFVAICAGTMASAMPITAAPDCVKNCDRNDHPDCSHR